MLWFIRSKPTNLDSWMRVDCSVDLGKSSRIEEVNAGRPRLGRPREADDFLLEVDAALRSSLLSRSRYLAGVIGVLFCELRWDGEEVAGGVFCLEILCGCVRVR